MKMQRMRTTALLTGICTVVMLFAGSVDVRAVDTVTLPLEVYGKDVVSVALPAISEDGESPFDFIIDPQGLIYATDAAKYGGGKVEEGATLLFRNHDGEAGLERHEAVERGSAHRLIGHHPEVLAVDTYLGQRALQLHRREEELGQ